MSRRARPGSARDQTVQPSNRLAPGGPSSLLLIVESGVPAPSPEAPFQSCAKKKHTYIWTCVSSFHSEYNGITNGVIVLLWNPIDTVQKQCLPSLFICSMWQLPHHESTVEVEGGVNDHYIKSAISLLASSLVLLAHGHISNARDPCTSLLSHKPSSRLDHTYHYTQFLQVR
jgi:hypothetical protein